MSVIFCNQIPNQNPYYQQDNLWYISGFFSKAEDVSLNVKVLEQILIDTIKRI